MRKIIILFAIIISISATFVIASNSCQLATPRYGVVQCVQTGQRETQKTSFGGFDGEWSSVDIPCLSNCELTSNDIKIVCGGIPWDESEVYKNGQMQNSYPILWNRGDNLIVRGRCASIGTNHPVPTETSITYQQDLIMLKEGWAGSLPDTPVSGSEGCVLNKYYDTTAVNSYLDPTSGQTQLKPGSTYPSLQQYPSNWKIGDHFIFINDWQTGIADISLTYDKDNNAYWCGGQVGSRLIYNVRDITSSTGNCYAVPQSIYRSNIQCCFPSDCANNPNYGPQFTCNPDDWKCEKTKPCNSQLDCDQTFGEGICENHQIVKWNCNFNKPWGDHSGTCEENIRAVSQCPSDCTSGEYYDDVQGQCKPRIEYIDCPAGKCCDSGGKYIPESCSSGLTCCKIDGSLVGECKISCDENNDKGISLSGVSVEGTKKTSNGFSIIATVIGLLVLIGIGGGFYFYKSGKPETKPKKVTKVKAGKVCKKCGAALSKEDKFCTGCGKKV